VKPAAPIRGLVRQCTLLLRSASLLVPKPRRGDWYREWYAEVWHWAHFLEESGRLNSDSRLELVRHCWGAFPDAAWHRVNQEEFNRGLEDAPRSARFCLASLSAIFLLAVLLTGFAPTLRSGFSRLPYYQPDRVAAISFQGNFSHYHEGTLFNSVADWSRRSRTAGAVAAYSFHPAEISRNGIAFTTLTARVSPNFFELLGSPAAMGRTFRSGDEADCRDCVVITNVFGSRNSSAIPLSSARCCG
jgi:hypothetical protein